MVTHIRFELDTADKLSKAMKIHAQDEKLKEPMKIHVSPKAHQRIRVTAAQLGVSMSDFMSFCVDGFMSDFTAARHQVEKSKRAEKGALPDPSLEESEPEEGA